MKTTKTQRFWTSSRMTNEEVNNIRDKRKQGNKCEPATDSQKAYIHDLQGKLKEIGASKIPSDAKALTNKQRASTLICHLQYELYTVCGYKENQ